MGVLARAAPTKPHEKSLLQGTIFRGTLWINECTGKQNPYPLFFGHNPSIFLPNNINRKTNGCNQHAVPNQNQGILVE
jgi:hypothetical protein